MGMGSKIGILMFYIPISVTVTEGKIIKKKKKKFLLSLFQGDNGLDLGLLISRFL